MTLARLQQGGHARQRSIRERAMRLLAMELEFVPNPSFRRADKEGEFAPPCEVGRDRLSNATTRSSRTLPPHLARLCETAPLTAAQERERFRRMNYAKFRFNALRSTLDPEAVDRHVLERAEDLLSEAILLRDELVRANLRLVVAVVKKFVTPYFSFDELLSDGMLSLLHAVEKFDYDRGFRFSTYAYRCLTRNLYRAVIHRRKEWSRCTCSTDEVDQLRGDLSSETEERAIIAERQLLARLVAKLDRREQFIIARRYALNDVRESQTFQSLADEMGLSKERVRQLELRAMTKLQQMAANLRPR